jgi:predicted CXXCH cytochrome family protein
MMFFAERGDSAAASDAIAASAVRQRRAGRLVTFFLSALVASSLCGCDPLTVHKVTTTIFDGVPSLPPADQYCKEYHQQALLEESAAQKKQQMAQLGPSHSEHPPYAQKRCDNCHDKNTESGFVVPAAELCAHCHTNFPRGEYLHGPAAVGACLKCHLPHNSDNPSLLVKPKGELCAVCHTEPRAAAAMHAKVTANGMLCTDCHDPHGGNNHYFLR